MAHYLQMESAVLWASFTFQANVQMQQQIEYQVNLQLAQLACLRILHSEFVCCALKDTSLIIQLLTPVPSPD